MDGNSAAPAQSIEFLLGRLDGKVDTLLKQVNGYDARLAAVEKKQYWLSGLGAMAAIVAVKLLPYTGVLPH